jgi:predicted outer membrane protein
VRSAPGTGLIIAALAATLAALLYPLWSYHLHTAAAKRATAARTVAARTVATRYGPLTAADRAFVLRVRQAGLWELPAGEQAMERGRSKAVRSAGERLVKGDTELDGQVREIASRLGIRLPDEPGRRERKWLGDLDAAHGHTYETTFADYLRRSQGEIFEAMGRVRNDTRNTLVRRLATTGSRTVLDQMTALEKTGLIDYDAITPSKDKAHAPTPAPSASSRPTGTKPSLPPAWSRPEPGSSRHGQDGRHGPHGRRSHGRHGQDATRTPPGQERKATATPQGRGRGAGEAPRALGRGVGETPQGVGPTPQGVAGRAAGPTPQDGGTTPQGPGRTPTGTPPANGRGAAGTTPGHNKNTSAVPPAPGGEAPTTPPGQDPSPSRTP